MLQRARFHGIKPNELPSSKPVGNAQATTKPDCMMILIWHMRRIGGAVSQKDGFLHQWYVVVGWFISQGEREAERERKHNGIKVGHFRCFIKNASCFKENQLVSQIPWHLWWDPKSIPSPGPHLPSGQEPGRSGRRSGVLACLRVDLLDYSQLVGSRRHMQSMRYYQQKRWFWNIFDISWTIFGKLYLRYLKMCCFGTTYTVPTSSLCWDPGSWGVVILLNLWLEIKSSGI